MRAEFADQYSRVCLALDGTETPDQVITRAHDDEATYFDGEDVCLVLRFPNRPQELYTESAVRRSALRLNVTGVNP